MLIISWTTTILQIFCELSLYSWVIFKSMREADDPLPGTLSVNGLNLSGFRAPLECVFWINDNFFFVKSFFISKLVTIMISKMQTGISIITHEYSWVKENHLIINKCLQPLRLQVPLCLCKISPSNIYEDILILPEMVWLCRRTAHA